MVPPIIRLLGTAILLDVFLLIATVPISKFLMTILIPANVATGSAVLWTYALVVLVGLIAILLFLLWMFEAWYAHLFSFWQLVVTMLVVMTGYLWWNGGL